MSFFRHRAYINSKPYVAIMYKDGKWVQVKNCINIEPIVFTISDGNTLVTSDGKTFYVIARDTDLMK